MQEDMKMAPDIEKILNKYRKILKPCPFCKQKPDFFVSDYTLFDVACYTEGCFLEHGANYFFIIEHIEILVNLWNNRR